MKCKKITLLNNLKERVECRTEKKRKEEQEVKDNGNKSSNEKNWKGLTITEWTVPHISIFERHKSKFYKRWLSIGKR